MAVTSTDKRIRGEFPVLVYYEDTDFTGYVYHANYLKFCERAREHLLGIERLRQHYASGFHFVLRRMQVDYFAPAHHGDQLTVVSSCALQESPRWSMIQEIDRKDAGKVTKIFKAEIELVHIEAKTGRPVRVPSELFGTD